MCAGTLQSVTNIRVTPAWLSMRIRGNRGLAPRSNSASGKAAAIGAVATDANSEWSNSLASRPVTGAASAICPSHPLPRHVQTNNRGTTRRPRRFAVARFSFLLSPEHCHARARTTSHRIAQHRTKELIDCVVSMDYRRNGRVELRPQPGVFCFDRCPSLGAGQVPLYNGCTIAPPATCYATQDFIFAQI